MKKERVALQMLMNIDDVARLCKGTASAFLKEDHEVRQKSPLA